ncbi:MAG: Bax inhibitor-1 family protein, partial [Pseudomonadota bacterium]|nr:Bax inhibitor-1 family protein [Pseudomonadota bacterium]
WGYTTKRDLGPMASFMMMGLIGVIMASLLMFIWPSPMMDFVISVASVFIFSGLIAAKTQFIRHEYQTVAIHGGEMAAKSATLAALSLYLSFINLFLAILRLMNNR